MTEFEQRAGGGGLRLGIGAGIFGGALSGESVNGVVAMDLRLIDTTTGQVVQSHRVEAKVSQSKIVEERRGEIELVTVQDKFSVAVMKTAFQATRGDLVKPPGR